MLTHGKILNTVSYISLFKSCFGIIFLIFYRTFSHQLVHKKNQIPFSFKALRSEIKIHINLGLS